MEIINTAPELTNLSDVQLHFLQSIYTNVVNGFQNINADHFGAEYTKDNSIFFYIRKDKIDIQKEVFFDYDTLTTFSVNNVFEDNELILNYSSKSIKNSIDKVLDYYLNNNVTR